MTLKELVRLWNERDSRYTLGRKDRLGVAEEASARAYRLREIDLLDSEDDRTIARLRLADWRLPQPVLF